MTPLEDLLVKWRDGSLSPTEQIQFNSWLRSAEARARLRLEFAMEAGLVEALRADQARAHTQQHARSFATLEVRRGFVLENFRARGWRALVISCRRWRSKVAFGGVALAVLVMTILITGIGGETVAHLKDVTAGVTLSRKGKTIQARSGLPVAAGDQIHSAATANATLVYAGEATQFELRSAARLSLENTDAGKRAWLDHGTLVARVAPQPKGRPFVIATPHSEAKILGTEFVLAVDEHQSRLEVVEGLVEFIKRDDGKSIMVTGGFFATAAAGLELTMQSLLSGPWQSQDIGDVGVPGFARLDGNRCTAKGAGRSTCPTKDQFHFVYQALEGDGEIRARVINLETAYPEAKAGVVVRESLKPTSPHAFLFLRSNGSLEFERRQRVESKSEHFGAGTAPCWMRLVRRGDVVSGFISRDGSNWRPAGSETIQMSHRVYAGLGVASWNNAGLATSVFDNVHVVSTGAQQHP